jgi:hypothetical protein
MSDVIEGGCRCGRVRYRVKREGLPARLRLPLSRLPDLDGQRF